MYAVIKSGGKQYKVAPGQIILTEKIEAPIGDIIYFDQVLLHKSESDLQVGAPLLSGIKVSAKVLDNFKGEKVIIFKRKRRKHHRKKNGHRQMLTRVQIQEIARI